MKRSVQISVVVLTLLMLSVVSTPSQAASFEPKLGTTVMIHQNFVSANTFSSFGYHAFTPQVPYWYFGDANGNGSEQINYDSGPREQWGYQAGAVPRGLATGNATEIADLYCGSKHVASYGRHVVPIDYLFHGSYGPLTWKCNYHTQIQIVFPIKGGTAKLSAQWNWRITYV